MGFGSRRITAVALLVGALALVISLPFVSVLQADSYKALYDGRWVPAHGIPHVNTLTAVAHGRPWIDEQWLAEVAFYAIWRIGGYAAVAGLALGAVALAYAIIAAISLRRGAHAGVAVCCGVGAVMTLSGWQFVRAQDLALPLFAALLALVVADMDRPRPGSQLILALPLLVLWANVHGSVLLGAGLTALYVGSRALGELHRRRFGTFAGFAGLALAAAGSPLATPYGTEIIRYYGQFVHNAPMAQMASEWSAPAVGSLGFYELVLPSLVLVVVLGACLWRGVSLPGGLLLAAALTGIAARFESGSIVWFGMVAAVLIADLITRLAPTRLELTRAAVPVLAAAAITALVVIQLAGRANVAFQAQLPGGHVMAETVAYTDAHPCARVLADNLTASALLWIDPRLQGRVGYDARLEQFSQPALRRWIAFLDGRRRGWATTVGDYRVLVADAYYAAPLLRRLLRLGTVTRLARSSDALAVVNRAAPSGCPRLT